MMKKLRQGGANWVDGKQFWDREDDIRLFMKQLDEGANLLLVAQRRMGKTSLMREVMRRLKDRYTCMFVDLQKAASAADAIVELSLAVKPHKSLWNKTTGLFKNILLGLADAVETIEFGELGVKLRAGLTESNWSEKGDQLLEILVGAEKPVVIFLDEVPIMVNRMIKGDDFAVTPEGRTKADAFMSWLRSSSIRHKGKLRFVVSGSIGFEPVLHQAGLSATLNTFLAFDLKPWDEATAIDCLHALANEYSVALEQGAAAEMVRKLGCPIPHHVQLFFSRVYERCVRRGRLEFSTEEVADVYEQEMLSVRGHAELTHYEERLKQVLGPETFPWALEMLTEAAVTGCLSQKALIAFQEHSSIEGSAVAETQMNILHVLEHDGYLKKTEDGYHFISSLLRDWWKKRYGAFFSSAEQRGN
ncbi:MAG: ATP-binding protein [Deltaproteobacteria bacterium]|nr:ATP-binding protein [Deltaproteobacteria bacterium]